MGDTSRPGSQTDAARVPRLKQPSSFSFCRQSTDERLKEILEGGRSRADTMAQDAAQFSRRPPSQAAGAAAAENNATPDETTGIVSRGSGHNYQALHTTATNRSKQSIYRRPSRGRTAEDCCSRENNAGRLGRNGGGGNASVLAKSWLRRKLGILQSIELENRGSVARDHLALERTFLAWLRTSLAFASIGVAVTQLFRLNTTISDGNGGGNLENATVRRLGKPLGTTFLGISILTLLLGARRYFLGQEWVIKGKFPASRGTIIIVALLSLAIMLASLVVVIVIHPPENEV